jgi:hypothetical protein
MFNVNASVVQLAQRRCPEPPWTQYPVATGRCPDSLGIEHVHAQANGDPVGTCVGI